MNDNTELEAALEMIRGYEISEHDLEKRLALLMDAVARAERTAVANHNKWAQSERRSAGLVDAALGLASKCDDEAALEAWYEAHSDWESA